MPTIRQRALLAPPKESFVICFMSVLAVLERPLKRHYDLKTVIGHSTHSWRAQKRKLFSFGGWLHNFKQRRTRHLLKPRYPHRQSYYSQWRQQSSLPFPLGALILRSWPLSELFPSAKPSSTVVQQRTPSRCATTRVCSAPISVESICDAVPRLQACSRFLLKI